jgi:hypothetical protein
MLAVVPAARCPEACVPRRRRIAAPAAAVASLVLLVAAAGCQSPQRAATGGPAAPSVAVAPVPARSAALATGHPHVMVIVEENHSLQQVIGNTQLPYLNGLANRYGLATGWTGLSHPSLPNYLGLISGSIQGNPQDTTPADRTYPGPTVVDQLARAGFSWKAYMQDMPRPCDLSDTYSPGDYDVNHNPFMFFDSIRDDPAQCRRVVPFTEFAGDLNRNTAPDFIWVSPNLLNDLHDGSYAVGDGFLQREMSIVLASRWYKDGGTVIVTFDEGDTTEQVATIVVAQHTPRGARLTASGSHYGTLRAIEETYGLPLLGGAANPAAGDLRHLF